MENMLMAKICTRRVLVSMVGECCSSSLHSCSIRLTLSTKTSKLENTDINDTAGECCCSTLCKAGEHRVSERSLAMLCKAGKQTSRTQWVSLTAAFSTNT